MFKSELYDFMISLVFFRYFLAIQKNPDVLG